MAKPKYTNDSEPKGAALGSRIFLWILIIILSLFALGFGGYGVFLSIANHFNSKEEAGTIVYENGSETTNEIGRFTDSSFKGITIHKSTGDTLSGKQIYSSARKSVMKIECAEDRTTGSAIVLTKNGYLLTTALNVGNSRSSTITVTDSENNSYIGNIVGYDNVYDIAVVKIEAEDLTPAVIGSMNGIGILDSVYIYSALSGDEYNGSIVTGDISAANRELGYDSVNSSDFIELNTVIPTTGNGGAVLNHEGQAVAMAISDAYLPEEYRGSSYAIPLSAIKDAVDSIIKNGYVSDKVMLGIVGTAVTKDIADEYGVSEGIYITELKSGGSFDGTEVKAGDIITSIDGKDVKSFSDVSKLLAKHKAGDKIKVTLCRIEHNGKIRTFHEEITLVPDNGALQNP